MPSPDDPSPRGPTLRVVSINDVYSLENLRRLKNLVRHHAVTDPADAMIVALAGDFLAPSILSSLDYGRGMVDCLNAVSPEPAERPRLAPRRPQLRTIETQIGNAVRNGRITPNRGDQS